MRHGGTYFHDAVRIGMVVNQASFAGTPDQDQLFEHDIS